MVVHNRLNVNIGRSLRGAKCKNCMRSNKSETASWKRHVLQWRTYQHIWCFWFCVCLHVSCKSRTATISVAKALQTKTDACVATVEKLKKEIVERLRQAWSVWLVLCNPEATTQANGWICLCFFHIPGPRWKTYSNCNDNVLNRSQVGDKSTVYYIEYSFLFDTRTHLFLHVRIFICSLAF